MTLNDKTLKEKNPKQPSIKQTKNTNKTRGYDVLYKYMLFSSIKINYERHTKYNRNDAKKKWKRKIILW